MSDTCTPNLGLIVAVFAALLCSKSCFGMQTKGAKDGMQTNEAKDGMQTNIGYEAKDGLKQKGQHPQYESRPPNPPASPGPALGTPENGTCVSPPLYRNVIGWMDWSYAESDLWSMRELLSL